MANREHGSDVCRVCGRPKPRRDLLHGDLIHGPVLDLVRETVPDLSAAALICLDCLNRARADFVGRALEEERGELTALDQEVLRTLREHELVSADPDAAFEQQWTLGERVADQVAAFGGSWRFIAIFAGVLGLWVGVNSVVALWRPFDPYPFILLNLLLSCLAAIQAPIIMMSQNRQEAKDRLRAQHDYRVNLKAELEVRQLHWKLDQLLNHQWRRLLEIQQVQTELMEELVRQPRRDRPR
jgi:uncharacterized membrane protein